MPVTAQKAFEISERRRRTLDRLIKGESMSDVARDQGRTPQAVSKDVKALKRQLIRECLEDAAEIIAEERHRLDLIEREAWAAWERSRLPAEITRTKTTTGGKDGTKDEAVTEVRYRDGNPEFVKIVLECHKSRLELLGVRKVSIVNVNQFNTQINARQGPLTDEDKARAVCKAFGIAIPDQEMLEEVDGEASANGVYDGSISLTSPLFNGDGLSGDGEEPLGDYAI